MRYLVAILLLATLVIGCKKETDHFPNKVDNSGKNKYSLAIPSGFPEPEIPEDNPVTEAKIKLGKKLFFEKRLSETNQVSCGSCHLPNLAFSDGKKVSDGVHGRKGVRNSPTVVNSAWLPRLMWDGGPRSLEAQVALPFDNPDELNLNIVEASNKIAGDKEYIDLFIEAFNTKPGPIEIAKALATYQRSLISGNSRFDQYKYQGKKWALTEQEQFGFELFMSEKFQCGSCHKPPLFTNNEFLNNGIYQLGDDSGRYRVTLHKPDLGKFKVPTLRNIEFTSPYMHDGRFVTLEQVVGHYKSGGNNYRTQDDRIKPIQITQQEQEALIAFLKSLTDVDSFADR